MQPLRNKIAQLEVDEVLDLEIEIVEGFAFLHLSLFTLTPELVKKLREELERVLSILQSRGYDTLFLTSTDEKSVKFWQFIKPCFEVMKLEDGTWLGSWITFKEA